MFILLLSFLTIILIIYLVLTLYLKCKMPFWAKQPVFHIYNGWYWLRPPGLIERNPPSFVDKYVDLWNIQTLPITELLEERATLLTTLCNFLKNNYVKDNKFTQYSPTPEHITAYLQASNHLGYCTIYQRPKLLFGKIEPVSTIEPVATIEELVAVITARPLYVRLKHKHVSFPTYYVDNLCVSPAYRKKNLAAGMIKTHYYNLRQKNSKIQTCLFKREGSLNAIVPLVAFQTYCFTLEAFTNTNTILPPAITLLDIGPTQLHLVVDFMKTHMHQFPCVILPDVTNFTHLIKTNNLKVYGLLEQHSMIALYVFRNTEQYYGNEKASECIATLSACAPTLFRTGFRLALQQLKNVSLVLIEDTAHANILLEPFTKTTPGLKFISPTAFFFYNYACYSFSKNDVLIIY